MSKLADFSEIAGVSGNQYLKLKLKENDIIITQLGSLICMSSGVDKADIKFDGILHGLSKLLAGEPLYYQVYKGKRGGGFIYLGSDFMNSIIVIKIKQGEVYRISRNSFLASTGNIKISFTFQAKGIFEIGQEEGFFLPTATCEKGEGYLWLCAYGNFEKITIPENKYLIIDNGTFLACNNNKSYEISKLGKTLFTSFLNGEGFGMKFFGPIELYIQTKNINNFLSSPPQQSNDNEGIINGVIDLFNTD